MLLPPMRVPCSQTRCLLPALASRFFGEVAWFLVFLLFTVVGLAPAQNSVANV